MNSSMRMPANRRLPRRAASADLDGLRRLIAPCVADGTLLPERARALPARLKNLWVLDEDGDIVACVELRIFSDTGENRLLGRAQ